MSATSMTKVSAQMNCFRRTSNHPISENTLPRHHQVLAFDRKKVNQEIDKKHACAKLAANLLDP